MKKILSLALATLMIALVLAAPVSAAPGKGSYGEVPMYLDGIEIDGVIDDAYTEFGLKIDASNDYAANYASDTTVDIYLLHDGEFLYIAYDAVDGHDTKFSKLPKADSSSAWKYAGTELYVDWAGKGTNAAKIMGMVDGQYYGSMDAQDKEKDYVADMKTTYDEASGAYVLEFKMPFADGAKVGGTIGFYAMITSNNDITVGGQNHIVGPKTDAAAANKPAEFYNVTLTDEVVAFPEEAPAEEAPAASTNTFDFVTVAAAAAALSLAGVVVSKKRK